MELSLKPGQLINYIPKSEKGKKDPIIIQVKYLSYAGNKENPGFRSYTNRIERRVAALTKGLRLDDFAQRKEIADEVGDAVDDEMLTENVKKITKSGQEFMPVDEFLARVDLDDRNDIVLAMRSASTLSENQSKNLSGASVGTSSDEAKMESPSPVIIATKKEETNETVETGEISVQQ